GGLDLVQRAPLDELALRRVERCELVVSLGEGLGLALDAEKLGNEILDVRRKRDEEFGLPAASRRGVPRCRQFAGERTVCFREVSEESAIEPDQAFALVQVGKGDAEA